MQTQSNIPFDLDSPHNHVSRLIVSVPGNSLAVMLLDTVNMTLSLSQNSGSASWDTLLCLGSSMGGNDGRVW